MPFGLRNVAQTFQRFIDTVLRGLKLSHRRRLSGIKKMKKNRHYLKEVFKRLKKYGLSINVAKRVFAEHEVKYLGYKVTKNGISPLEKRVTAVIKFKNSETIF